METPYQYNPADSVAVARIALRWGMMAGEAAMKGTAPTLESLRALAAEMMDEFGITDPARRAALMEVLTNQTILRFTFHPDAPPASAN